MGSGVLASNLSVSTFSEGLVHLTTVPTAGPINRDSKRINRLFDLCRISKAIPIIARTSECVMPTDSSAIQGLHLLVLEHLHFLLTHMRISGVIFAVTHHYCIRAM